MSKITKTKLLETQFPLLNYKLCADNNSQSPPINHAPNEIERWYDFSDAISRITIEDTTIKCDAIQIDPKTFWKRHPGEILHDGHLQAFMREYIFRLIFNEIFELEAAHDKEAHELKFEDHVLKRKDKTAAGRTEIILAVEIKTRKPDGRGLSSAEINQQYLYMGFYGIKYSVLTTYEETWFFMRTRETLRISEAVEKHDLLKTLYRFSKLAAGENTFEALLDLTPDSVDQKGITISLGKCIGTGKFSQVYEARLKKEGRHSSEKIAVKIGDILKFPHLGSELKAEAKILKRLDGNMFVPRLFYHGKMNSIFYVIAMQRVHGRHVEFEKLSSAQKAKAIRALKSIHKFNIVHNDIEPRNLLVHGNRVKIIDFGQSAFTNHKHAFEHELNGLVSRL